MEKVKEELVGRLLEVVEALPSEQVNEVLDFAGYLESQYRRQTPPRGSADAIIAALEKTGPLLFDPGEMESLLTEIAGARESDMEEHGDVSA